MLVQKHDDNGLTSAPTLIYGGRGMDGRSYILFRVWIVSFRGRHTLRRP